MKCLFLIGFTHFGRVAQWTDRLISCHRHACCILRFDPRIVAKLGEWTGQYPIGKPFVSYRRDVISLKAAIALGDIHVFAPQLQTANFVAGALNNVGEFLCAVGFTRKVFVEYIAAYPIFKLAAVLVHV